MLCEGDGNGPESLTGTCAICFPRWACTVVTSNRSGFCLESLIFGIERLFYEGSIIVQVSEEIGLGYR